jgi:hypothetical protein
VFIAYVDTLWAPVIERLNNNKRFTLLAAIGCHRFSDSYSGEADMSLVQPFRINQNVMPRSMAGRVAYLKKWQEIWKGTVFFYEYHFWRHQFLDPGMVTFARRVYEDVRSLKVQGVDGYVEDGSQRSGFPNAFPVYIYAETLMNRECDFEEVKADYFSHIYGKDWKEAESLLSRMTSAFDFAYMEGTKSKNRAISPFYDPERAPRLAAIAELCAEEKALAAKHLSCPTRPQTISWRLLSFHAEYCAIGS